LLAGGDRSAFQQAASKERELVADLTGEALKLVADEGERAGAGLDEKVSATLHAAALETETADELRRGRLTREREAIAGFGAFAAPDAAPARRAPSRQAKSKPTSKSKSKSKREPKATAHDARERQRLAAARTDERHARRELDAAAKAVEHAETRAEAAEAHAADAVKRAKIASERVKEARSAQAASRKAHTRAERALKAAEGS
jgi:hypothetical protein